MDLKTAVDTVVVRKYAEFEGRASRAEYWWFVLAYFIAVIIAGVIDGMLGTQGIVGGVLGLALLIPSVALAVRRFHDIGKSGWWVLIFLIPIVGFIALLYFFTKKGQPGSNQFGPTPA